MYLGSLIGRAHTSVSEFLGDSIDGLAELEIGGGCEPLGIC